MRLSLLLYSVTVVLMLLSAKFGWPSGKFIKALRKSMPKNLVLCLDYTSTAHYECNVVFSGGFHLLLESPFHRKTRSEDEAMSNRVSCSEDSPTGTETEFWISSLTGNKKLEDEYLLGDIIGRGGSSVVFKCLRKGRTEWACKVLKKSQLDKKSVQSQLPALLKLKHPNIVPIKEVFETQDEVQLILELAEGGELLERIVERGHYSEKDAAKAVRDILDALQYLHSRGIIHRDLKPENLLYQTEMEDSVLKLADCGMNMLLSDDSRSCNAFGCSAPEILLDKEIEPSIDLWSLGVVTYIILCGFEPFWDEEGEMATSRKIVEGDYAFPSPWWDDISDSAKELITKLLSVDCKSRPTAEEALNHPWTLGLSTPTLHMDRTILRLREFNARRRFRVATKAVMATHRALNLLSPEKKTQRAGGKAVSACVYEKPKDVRTSQSGCVELLPGKTSCDCSVIGGSVSDAANELLSLSIAGRTAGGKIPTDMADKLSSEYNENHVGLK